MVQLIKIKYLRWKSRVSHQGTSGVIAQASLEFLIGRAKTPQETSLTIDGLGKQFYRTQMAAMNYRGSTIILNIEHILIKMSWILLLRSSISSSQPGWGAVPPLIMKSACPRLISRVGLLVWIASTKSASSKVM